MLHDILFLILGIALIVAGGNFVTDGAVALARKFKVSNLVIGLTVVAFGSSTPDLVVCLTSTLQGKSQLAVGDIVGANLFDILMVIGVVALIKPIPLSRDMLRKDLPMLALASCAMFICADDIFFDGATVNLIDRTDGLMLLAFFTIFMIFSLQTAKQPDVAPLSSAPDQAKHAETKSTPTSPAMKLPLSIVYIIGGLAMLIVGGNWIVDGASGIALKAGWSEALIGLTIVAIGSSLPDLATSVIAAIKKQPGIALGNVVGACIFNVFFIIGLCSSISPLHTGTITFVDFASLAGGAVLVWAFGQFFGKRVINRFEGAILVLGYIAYMTYLVITAG